MRKIRKKFLKTLMLASFLWISNEIVLANTISVDGELFEVTSILVEERTLIGASSFVNSIGGEISWNEEERLVTITHEDIIIELTIDSEVGIINGDEVELEVPAIIYNESTFLPLRFIAESLGFSVNFRNGIAVILTPNFVPFTLQYLRENYLELDEREVILLFHNRNLVGERIEEGYYTVIGPRDSFGFFSVLNENENVIFTEGILGEETPQFIKNLLPTFYNETTVYLLENHTVYLEDFEYLIFIR